MGGENTHFIFLAKFSTTFLMLFCKLNGYKPEMVHFIGDTFRPLSENINKPANYPQMQT